MAEKMEERDDWRDRPFSERGNRRTNMKRDRARSEGGKAFSELIIDEFPTGMLVADRDGNITFANRTTERLFGYSREELVGQTVEFLVPERFRRQHAGERDAFTQAPQVRPMGANRDLVGRCKDGREIPIEIGLKPFETAEGFFTLATIVDISERQSRTVQTIERLKLESDLRQCFTVQEAYPHIASLVKRLFPNESGAMFLIDAETGMAGAVVEWGRDGEPLTPASFPARECGAIRQGRPFVAEGGTKKKRCSHGPNPPPAACICVPMVAQGEILGIFHVGSGAGQKKWAPAKKHLVEAVADQCAGVVATLREKEKFRLLSMHDALTGLSNRRSMEETLVREIHQAARSHRPLSVIIFDVDHFKQFNDTFGHEGGDALLCEFAALLQRTIRKSDVCCRYGGEEFVVVLPEASQEDTWRVADRVRALTQDIRVTLRQTPLGTTTCSAGVASYPAHGKNSRDLLRSADEALYRAKRGGRNRVEVAR